MMSFKLRSEGGGLRLVIVTGRVSLMLAALNAMASPEVQAQLEQVKSERTRVEASFDEFERQCHQKINVTDCRHDVQLKRSDAIRPLMARQRDLEAALRKERAQEQRAKAQERRESHEQRQRDRTPRPDLPLLPPDSPRPP